jgi:hypothetical protein
MNDKPRLVMISDWEEIHKLYATAGDLGSPHVIKDKDGVLYVDADELRAWRASQCTSLAEPTK